MELCALEVIETDPPYKLNFLELHRMKLRNIYADQSKSKPYTCEASLRRHLDAVAVLLFEHHANGLRVYLRETLRPAILFRERQQNQLQGERVLAAQDYVLLEVVAGLLEEKDLGEEGKRQRALAEVWEEAGYRIALPALVALGAAILPTPGMNPEQIHLFAASVKGIIRQPPPGDGSPIEEVGELKTFLLDDALQACIDGRIVDAKTQICLHRLDRLAREKKL